MFKFILDYIRDSADGRFKLVVYKELPHPVRNENDIIEGLLIGEKDQKVYPIINGVPRLIPSAFIDNMWFYKKYRTELRRHNIKFNKYEINRFIKRNKQVKARFEFQWKIWGRSEKIYGMTQDEYKYHIFERMPSRKITDSEFKGKIFFEGGCGHGMVSQIMSPICKEYIGLDLGSGIDCARWRSKRLSNVHLIQGDLLRLPVKKASIDFTFSNGVIHHTPNTKKAFDNLASITKRGGQMMIWVYPKGGILWESVNFITRSITSRLPPKMLYYLSYLMIPVLYVIPAYADNKPGKNTPKELTQSIYDWLSPKHQTHHTPVELAKWFRSAGFSEIEQMDMATGALATSSDRER